jgi:hypothetical protein
MVMVQPFFMADRYRRVRVSGKLMKFATGPFRPVYSVTTILGASNDLGPGSDVGGFTAEYRITFAHRLGTP